MNDNPLISALIELNNSRSTFSDTPAAGALVPRQGPVPVAPVRDYGALTPNLPFGLGRRAERALEWEGRVELAKKVQADFLRMVQLELDGRYELAVDEQKSRRADEQSQDGKRRVAKILSSMAEGDHPMLVMVEIQALCTAMGWKFEHQEQQWS